MPVTKHASGQRAGGKFPKLRGGINTQNKTALDLVDSILKDPNSTFTNLARGGLDVRGINGLGIRFNKGGMFNTFLDPRL